MKTNLTPFRFLRSIGVRISATCWLVTLLTLALYVTVNLPQQKKDLLDALKSKAQGVSSSLQDVTAGAAMSEDYSTVVDHCVQVLKGDDAIEYLVITRTDGFSVIVDRNGWRTETLGEFWRPPTRGVIAEITYVPLIGKRVFRYARPFDYSAIHWGWVNVGLSTAAYDQSVARVHERSAILAILAASLSLLVSFGQARRPQSVDSGIGSQAEFGAIGKVMLAWSWAWGEGEALRGPTPSGAGRDRSRRLARHISPSRFKLSAKTRSQIRR